jgi:hypothetical protein
MKVKHNMNLLSENKGRWGGQKDGKIVRGISHMYLLKISRKAHEGQAQYVIIK